MPLKRIVCPHCEQAVEVPMTSVTRSRACPNCGNMILLQFTTTEKRQRRKALLMPSVDQDGGAGEASESLPPGLAVAPQPIQGDLRERMLADPEVRQRVKVIKISVAAITVILLLVILGSVFHWWSGIAGAVSGVVKQYNASRLASADDSGVDLKDPKALPRPVLPTETPSLRPPTEDIPKPATKPITVPESPLNSFKQDDTPQEDAVIMKAVMSFLDAPNMNERLNFVLNRVTAETKMREYYKNHPDRPVPYDTVESLGRDTTLTNILAYAFAVTMKDGERRRLIVGRSKGHKYLVDWPSFVIYSEMDWGQFVSTRPTKSVSMRIMAQLTDVYRGDFVDPEKYLCLKIINPLDVHADPLFAYAHRTSSLGRKLEVIMRHSVGAALPLMLKLSFPEAGGGGDQVLVDEFLREGWVSFSGDF